VGTTRFNVAADRQLHGVVDHFSCLSPVLRSIYVAETSASGFANPDGQNNLVTALFECTVVIMETA